jgi:hypothetical protein
LCLLISNETQNDEIRNRKKNHSLVPYHCQYTGYWLHLRAGKKFPQRSNCYQVGYLSLDCLIRSLDVEGSFVEKMVEKNEP